VKKQQYYITPTTCCLVVLLSFFGRSGEAVGLSAISFSAPSSPPQKKDAAPIPNAEGLQVISCVPWTKLLTTHSSWLTAFLTIFNFFI
jgi:hypothetical protein